MNPIIEYFPDRLKEIIGINRIEENVTGCSDARIFLIKNYDNNRNAYLKIKPQNTIEKLYHEKQVLNWLKNKLAVPEVLYFETTEFYEFMLISEIKGVPSYYEELRSDKYKILSLIAKGLKEIHQIDIRECSFDESISKKFKVIDSKLSNNEVDCEDFEEENRGKSVESLYDKMIEIKPSDEEKVFTHGDFCMPNIIIDNNQINGFIDLGRAGISDKYQDISLMVRSLKHNGFGDEHIDYFIREYGIEKLDLKKIEFYKLVDEFY